MSNTVKHFIADGAMVACYLISGYLMHNHWGYSFVFVIMGSICNKISSDYYKEI